MAAPPQSVIILGGGTAGWMTASLLHRRWSDQGTKVSLIESKEIGIIGVGEGSTPQLKAFFDEIGVAEHEWMPRCNATYKAGIEFAGWSDAPGFERYFHPFPTDVDGFTQPKFFHATRARRTGRDVPAHPDPFFVPTRIAREGLAPIAPSNFPFFVSYGYHFDAHLIGAFLRDLGPAAASSTSMRGSPRSTSMNKAMSLRSPRRTAAASRRTSSSTRAVSAQRSSKAH